MVALQLPGANGELSEREREGEKRLQVGLGGRGSGRSRRAGAVLLLVSEHLCPVEGKLIPFVTVHEFSEHW